MSRELLAEATRALREESLVPQNDIGRAAARRRAEQTRDRLMTDLRSGRKRRRRGLFLVPLAAILIGSTAWASGVLPAARRALLGGDEESERREQPTRVETVQLEPPPKSIEPLRASPVVDVEAEPEVEADAPDDPEVAPTLPEPAASAAPVAAAPAQPERHEAKPEPGADLYRAAHDAHFGQNNPSLALQRWNAYIAAAPKGRFIPEALYNRALCLVRLGQHDAAVAALKPFAAGSYGAYRQAEAKRLVAALASSP
jgi:hypothetical protein